MKISLLLATCCISFGLGIGAASQAKAAGITGPNFPTVLHSCGDVRCEQLPYREAINNDTFIRGLINVVADHVALNLAYQDSCTVATREAVLSPEAVKLLSESGYAPTPREKLDIETFNGMERWFQYSVGVMLSSENDSKISQAKQWVDGFDYWLRINFSGPSYNYRDYRMSFVWERLIETFSDSMHRTFRDPLYQYHGRKFCETIVRRMAINHTYLSIWGSPNRLDSKSVKKTDDWIIEKSVSNPNEQLEFVSLYYEKTVYSAVRVENRLPTDALPTKPEFD